MLLRVPDELHRRLTERAAREGRSVNALASEVLAVAASVEPASRQGRLRLRAASLGLAAHDDPYRPGSSTLRERAAALEAMRGVGPIADTVLAELRRER
jgi:antitoxin FitA